MSLPLINREIQLQNQGFIEQPNELSDALFDGILITPGVIPQNWRLESQVHQSVILSRKIDTTRNFLGPQTNIVRDEVRKTTWAAFIEKGSLIVMNVSASGTQRTVLAPENVWRSHIVLDKYSGTIRAAWITRINGTRHLWLDGVQLSTVAADPDFPYLDLSQVSIGHVQDQPASFGLLSYKDRSTGKIYIRRLDGGGLGVEQEIAAPSTIGGMSFAISGDRVLSRIDALDAGRLVPMISQSSDGGMTFDSFTAIDLPYGPGAHAIPSPPPVVDYLGHFHIPVTVTDGSTSVAANVVMDQAFVEAIEIPGRVQNISKIALERFPKKPVVVDTLVARFGNGLTDGLGLIMVIESGGLLFTSNSQAGGIHFPAGVHLNHEMPKIACYDSTECYTGGITANTVSMDYIYLELDPETGQPVCGDLHFETWDMPLPAPVVMATADGAVVHMEITKDANFEPGATSFRFQDQSVGIIGVVIHDARHATITTTVPSAGGSVAMLCGKILEFEVLTTFYHHAGEIVIS